MEKPAPAGVAQWLEGHPAHQGMAGESLSDALSLLLTEDNNNLANMRQDSFLVRIVVSPTA